MVLIGLGIAPNTSKIGQSPSGPTILFTEYTSMDNNSESVVSLFKSDLILSYADLSGALYRATWPIVPGVYIGAPLILKSAASQLDDISFEKYALPW